MRKDKIKGETHFWNGGEEEIRTPDPHVANVMLYQLSYFPIRAKATHIIPYFAGSLQGGI